MEFSVQKNVHLKCSPLFPSRVHFDFQIRNEFHIPFQWISLLGLCPMYANWSYELEFLSAMLQKICNRKNFLLQYNHLQISVKIIFFPIFICLALPLNSKGVATSLRPAAWMKGETAQGAHSRSCPRKKSSACCWILWRSSEHTAWMY